MPKHGCLVEPYVRLRRFTWIWNGVEWPALLFRPAVPRNHSIPVWLGPRAHLGLVGKRKSFFYLDSKQVVHSSAVLTLNKYLYSNGILLLCLHRASGTQAVTLWLVLCRCLVQMSADSTANLTGFFTVFLSPFGQFLIRTLNQATSIPHPHSSLFNIIQSLTLYNC